MTGTNDMRTERATAGSRPEITPRMGCTSTVSTYHHNSHHVNFTYLGNISDPSQARNILQRVDLGNQTNNTNGNGPEDDEGSNEAIHSIAADNNLPPGNGQALPDDLARLDANRLGFHVQGLVVSDRLVCVLGVALGLEFDKNSVDFLVVARPPVGLGLFDFGNQFLQLVAAPFDGVDLFANEAKKAKTVMRAILVLNPARSNVASLDVTTLGISRRRVLCQGLALLQRLGASLVDLCQETNLALFKLHGGLVALLDHFVQLVRLAANPDILDGTIHVADALLAVVFIRNRGEQNSAGRDPLGVVRVDVVCLAQVDVEDALARNHVHEKPVDDPANKGVGIEIILMTVNIHIAVRQDLELRQALASRGVDREQNGPGDEQADKTDGEADAQVSQEEIGVEALVGEDVCVGDLPKGRHPGQEIAGYAWCSLTVESQYRIKQYQLPMPLHGTKGLLTLRANILDRYAAHRSAAGIS